LGETEGNHYYRNDNKYDFGTNFHYGESLKYESAFSNRGREKEKRKEK